MTDNTMKTNSNKYHVIFRKNSDCTDEEATDLIRQGLTDAFHRENARKEELSHIPVNQRKALITENFPIVEKGEKLITAMSESDLTKLRLKSYYSDKRRMKDMFKKVQEQIAEYHELLEHCQTMESRVDNLGERATSLEKECHEKTLKVSQLEKEVVHLKVSLATEKSSAGRMSNELARVKSENQVLIKNISMQSLQSTSSIRSMATTSMSTSTRNRDGRSLFGLVRPTPSSQVPKTDGNNNIDPPSMSDHYVEEVQQQDQQNFVGNKNLMNRTLSWMNSHAKFLASEQQDPTSSTTYPAPASCYDPRKSTATATTGATFTSTASLLFGSFNTANTAISSPDNTSITCDSNSHRRSKMNEDWSNDSIIRPMALESNPLLMQLKE